MTTVENQQAQHYNIFEYTSFNDIPAFDGNLEVLDTRSEVKTFQDRNIKQILDRHFTIINSKYEFGYIGLTCVYSERQKTAEQSWDTIYDDLKRVHDILNSYDDTVYFVSCIEVNCGTTKVKRSKNNVKDIKGKDQDKDGEAEENVNKSTNSKQAKEKRLTKSTVIKGKNNNLVIKNDEKKTMVYKDDNLDVPIDTSTKELNADLAAQLRDLANKRQEKKNELCERFASGEIDGDTYFKLLDKFDHANDLLKAKEKINDRDVIVHKTTMFPIIWNSPEDIYRKYDRYYVSKTPYKPEDCIYTELDLLDEPKSNKGFAHLHIAICYSNKNGILRDPQTYIEDIGGIFRDSYIGSKKTKQWKKGKRAGKNEIQADCPRASLSYVLKNNRHDELITKLGNEHLRKRIIINLKDAVPEIFDMFYQLCTEKQDNNVVKQGLELTIINKSGCSLASIRDRYITEIDKKREAREKGEIYIPNIEISTNSKLSYKKNTLNDQLTKAINTIRSYMEVNNMVVIDGSIFIKYPKSKKTYILWKNNENNANDLYNEIIADPDNSYMINYKNKLIDSLRDKGQKIYPRFEMQCSWIEFYDCYFCLPTATITRCDIDEYCIQYYPEITYNMIKDVDEIAPRRLLEIIYNSVREELLPNFLKMLFKIFLPKKHKDGTLFLLGEPNSGKTTLLDAVKRFYPKTRIGYFSKSLTFSLEGIIDKDIISVDEGVNLDKVDSSTLLKLFEGVADITIDCKNKKSSNCIINGHILLASNRDFTKLLGDTERRAFNVRLAKFNFISLPSDILNREEDKDEVRREVIAETPLLILFLANQVMGIKFDDVNANEKYREWKRNKPVESFYDDIELVKPQL